MFCKDWIVHCFVSKDKLLVVDGLLFHSGSQFVMFCQLNINIIGLLSNYQLTGLLFVEIMSTVKAIIQYHDCQYTVNIRLLHLYERMFLNSENRECPTTFMTHVK